jgi:hypothetical protein
MKPVSSVAAALELPILLCMGLFRDFLLAQALTADRFS